MPLARLNHVAISGMRRSRVCLVLCFASPALAADPAPSPPPVMEEVIVTGRRDGEPDFQEQHEFHLKEYRRLKEIYEPDPPNTPRHERLTRMPEAITSTVQGRPTLTEKHWK